MAFTAPVTRATDFLVTAAIWNTEHVDNFNTAVMHLIARKSGDESLPSSTVLQDDDTLIAPVGTTEVWKFEYSLLVTGAAGDIHFGFTYPASGTVSSNIVGFNTSSTLQGLLLADATSPADASSWLVTSDTVPCLYVIPVTYTGGGTAGSLTLQWAQATSNATATVVKANSTLWGVKLA